MRIAKINPDEVAERDDVAAMLVAFYFAMAQGAARRNLRVIAKVLANKTAYPESGYDDFMMWVDAIASLTHEETIFLATLHSKTEHAKTECTSEEEIFKRAIANTRSELLGPTKLIKSEDDLQATCGALARTGFIILVNLLSGISAAPSPRLAKLEEMANLQDWSDSERECP